MLTKTEAVNELLDAIGEDPVNSVSSGLPEAEKAERFLDRETKRVLGKGWHWNTDENVKVSRNTSNRVPIAPNVIRIDTVGEHAHIDVARRRDPTDEKVYLFDKENQTFTFDKDLRCDVVKSYDFEDLPLELQFYITAHAARLFQESELGSVALDKFVVRKESEAWAALIDAAAEADDANPLDDSPSLLWARRGPYRVPRQR